MSQTAMPRVMRIAHDQQLAPWPDMPVSDVETGDARQFGHIDFEDPLTGVSVGSWSANAHASPWIVYPHHETMIVLEGTIHIETRSGRIAVGPGEAFFIPKDLELRWSQTGTVRKIFMIIGNARATVKPDADVVKIDPAMALAPAPSPAAGLLLKGSPEQTSRDVHEDAAIGLAVGVWTTTPYHRRLISFPRHELMHFLEGSVTLTDETGHAELFAAGETAFVPHGAPCDWLCEEPVRKVYSIVLPTA